MPAVSGNLSIEPSVYMYKYPALIPCVKSVLTIINKVCKQNVTCMTNAIKYTAIAIYSK